MNCSEKLLFKNLWLADGSGAPLRKCAVLTDGERIAAVEPSITESAADRVFDLGRKLLAPGFIDAHGHSDLSLPARPQGFGKISQGVTCEIAGNCGLSAFPVNANNRTHLNELYRQYGVDIDWDDFRSWQAELARRGAVLKLTALCGHNTLRAAVAGYERKTLTESELQEMGRLLREALHQGAAGLSTGLLYVPGKFADEDEIIFLMKILAAEGGIYATHLRSEGDRLLESLAETIECARRAGLKRLQISHFKTAGRANWPKLDAALELLEEARASGMELTVDRYPYTESMTQLSVILPGAWSDLDDQTIGRKLAEAEAADSLERELDAARPADYWSTVRLVTAAVPGLDGCAGMMLDRIAARLGCSAAAVVVRILRHDAAGATAAFRGMSEENLRRIIALPWCMAGSDENARPADDSIGRSHPRAFGALPRFLRLRLEAGAPIEAAVHQVTGVPAQAFRLRGRGVLAPGNAADLTAFDPDEIDGTTDFTAPHTPATGIRLVAVDGKVVYRN